MKSLKNKIVSKALGKLISQMMKDGNFTVVSLETNLTNASEDKETETKK